MISALIIYTQFFSRIPIPKAVDISYVRRGIAYISFFGLLLGGVLSVVYYMLQLILPGIIAWIMTFFVDILLTGGFHLDGLADMSDGLFSSRDRDRMLEIMKDSRVGSNGVLALIFYYSLMFVSYTYLPEPKWLIVACFSMIGKAGLALQLYKMTYARQDGGSGQLFTGTRTRDIALAQILPLVILYLGYSWKGLAAYLLVFLGSIGYRWFVYQKIKGHTGDTLGAFVEISHILLLIGLMI